MTVARYQDPNYTTQTAAQYKANLDAAAKVMKRLGDWFAPHQVYAGSPNPDLAVELDAGWIFKGNTLSEITSQIVTGFTIPSAGQNRVDRVVLNPFTGVAQRVAGTAVTGSPSATAPEIPAGTIPICQVYITSSDTVITDAMITDERVHAGVDLMLEADLVELFHVDYDTGHRDLAAARYDPAFFNQQWGGAPHYFEMVDAATGTPYRFEAATGYLDDIGTGFALASAAGNTWRYQSFKVSKDTTVARVWLTLGSKTGNPTNNLNLRIVTDNGSGKPSGTTAITNGTAVAVPMKSVSSGRTMVAFTFATPPSLSANTAYHFLISSSGAVDGSNYFTISGTNSKKYPHGACGYGDATPTWTSDGSDNHCYAFLIEAATGSLSTGGLFSDGKYTFYEGSPLNQSNGRVKDLKDFRGLDLTDFTLLVRGTAWTKDKTILEFQYGLDHDRIVLRANATTGYAQIDVYESDGTKHTVTGTTDVSTGDHDIMIRVRAKADGSDAVSLYVDGSSQGTPVSSATITFDTLFGLAQIGTFWIGGGFALAPTWTDSQPMSVLPSANGWSFSGTATEGNVFSVSGGNLYQNYNGYASTDTGYYGKAVGALSNPNGWSITWALAVLRGAAIQDTASTVRVDDGTKNIYMELREYYLAVQSTGAWVAKSQFDGKSKLCALHGMGKGSDCLIFSDGRLVCDGTGQLTQATGGTGAGIQIGDLNAAASANADARWGYWNYYTTAWLPPQFTAGSLSELAIWTGDKTSLASPLYNSGTFVSVKQYCGVRKNYLDELPPRRIVADGVTSGPTTTTTWGTGFSMLADMEAFVIGTRGHIDFRGPSQNSSISFTVQQPVWDGKTTVTKEYMGIAQPSNAGYYDSVSAWRPLDSGYFGLHKADVRWAVSADTGTSGGTARRMIVEIR